ncbi:hypothetical protein PR048_003867 [Dryococelus australis]|uniref:Uncharacterized protein n=1 Tax=Dryococelus australis TaxID=614101 RepID=A0ABQ9IPQ4_9NEOP|nr:hypothetical protein PR048_003867 [Dryococelus australis]
MHFHIVKDLEEELILGMPWLIEQQVTIDCHQEKARYLSAICQALTAPMNQHRICAVAAGDNKSGGWRQATSKGNKIMKCHRYAKRAAQYGTTNSADFMVPASPTTPIKQARIPTTPLLSPELQYSLLQRPVPTRRRRERLSPPSSPLVGQTTCREQPTARLLRGEVFATPPAPSLAAASATADARKESAAHHQRGDVPATPPASQPAVARGCRFRAVLFASEGSKVEVVNLESLSAVCLSMPFPVGLLHLAAVDKWLVEDMSGQKHVLAKRQPEDPCPTVLQDIQETSDLPGPISSCALGQLEGDLLSRALGQSVSAPHRVLSTENSFATIVLGFPELDHSSNEVYVWPRRESLSGSSVTLLDQAQVVRAVPTSVAPREAYSERGQHSGLSGFLEVSDLANNKLRYIPVPQPLAVSPVAAWMYQKAELPLHLVATSHSGLATVDAGGCIRLWETGLANLEQSLLEWRKMIGSTYIRPSYPGIIWSTWPCDVTPSQSQAEVFIFVVTSKRGDKKCSTFQR